MSENSTNKPPIWFWIVSVIGLVWNGMGVDYYLGQAYKTERWLAQHSTEQLELMANNPTWLTAAFAIAVFGGILGCLALLLKKKIAKILFLLSFIAVIIQQGYIFINGYNEGYLMHLMIIIFSILLLWLSRKSISNHWIS